MKKSSMETIVTYLTEMNDPRMMDIKAEIEAELAKGKAKADANRALYDEIQTALISVLSSATAPVTAQELADETNYPKGKIVYGLAHYWNDQVEKIEGKVNTYVLKEKA